ncbi:hypothetical protein ZYGR_0S00130 [Zygosaccharomyces rouxii]|uniref:ZYRO0F02794p n=2 Tax=Zygosaccharomyces rouxii TaxID=4956 RepID=C5DX75_ZYGRC|nr:uncharacterized protein ZYRO0F02794g [Zygosaccharomyces rouxii]KAH9199150.1 hypothetical protein LQ764DRAFT_125591 [Zygosaccharomyces rouxii]GAV49881.1 hypothetical protein ZYGR_0S00130 [Zygosaccharomyces rouxii]CAR28386.1 ZYRO0F02794p [Zygosaccharomyces rouxii]
MAGKSSKKQAQSNLLVLRNLYVATIPVVLLASTRQWISKRDIVNYIRFILLHLPLLGCIYVLDSSGRPKYDSKNKLIREGLDLSQSGGLTEYMFDVIYLSLFGDLGHILFNTKKFWYALILVPVYAIWKIYGLMPSLPTAKAKDGDDQHQKPGQSKRQAKLAKRQDKVQVKYR